MGPMNPISPIPPRSATGADRLTGVNRQRPSTAALNLAPAESAGIEDAAGVAVTRYQSTYLPHDCESGTVRPSADLTAASVPKVAIADGAESTLGRSSVTETVCAWPFPRTSPTRQKAPGRSRFAGNLARSGPAATRTGKGLVYTSESSQAPRGSVIVVETEPPGRSPQLR